MSVSARRPQTNLDHGPHASEVNRGLIEHLPSLRAHARRRTHSADAAQDLVQETSVRALKFAWSYEPGSNVRAWLHQILESVFMSHCRKRARERRAFEALVSDPCAWTRKDDGPAMCSLSPRIHRALNELPQGFREVVKLVDVDELSYRDAADRLAVPLGTVMSRLHRGRRLLASALTDAPYGSNTGVSAASYAGVRSHRELSVPEAETQRAA